MAIKFSADLLNSPLSWDYFTRKTRDFSPYSLDPIKYPWHRVFIPASAWKKYGESSNKSYVTVNFPGMSESAIPFIDYDSTIGTSPVTHTKAKGTFESIVEIILNPPEITLIAEFKTSAFPGDFTLRYKIIDTGRIDGGGTALDVNYVFGGEITLDEETQEYQLHLKAKNTITEELNDIPVELKLPKPAPDSEISGKVDYFEDDDEYALELQVDKIGISGAQLQQIIETVLRRIPMPYLSEPYAEKQTPGIPKPEQVYKPWPKDDIEHIALPGEWRKLWPDNSQNDERPPDFVATPEDKWKNMWPEDETKKNFYLATSEGWRLFRPVPIWASFDANDVYDEIEAEFNTQYFLDLEDHIGTLSAAKFNWATFNKDDITETIWYDKRQAIEYVYEDELGTLSGYLPEFLHILQPLLPEDVITVEKEV